MGDREEERGRETDFQGDTALSGSPKQGWGSQP